MTKTTTKMTKRDHFNTLLTIAEVQANPILVEFINHELELLVRKNSGEKKPTATQALNDSIKTTMLAEMESGTLYTVSDMIKQLPCCADLSSSKVTSLVHQLCDCEPALVERVVEKRRAYFRKIDL